MEKDSGRVPDAVKPLVAEAFQRHGASCLWNVPRPSSLSGAMAVARSLRDNGGMAAWNLAARIEEACDRVTMPSARQPTGRNPNGG